VSRLDEARAALEAVRAQQAERPLDLFGPPADLEPVTIAIATAAAHTSTDWKRRALDAVHAAAVRHPELTVEDVDWPDDLEPDDDRARGGVMRAAARSGWIASTRTYRPSERPETHRRPLLVWRSRIAREA